MSLSLVNIDGNPLSSRDVDASGNNFIYVIGSITETGTYTAQASGGDILDFTTLGSLLEGKIVAFDIKSASGGTDRFLPVSNALASAWSLKITDAGGTELANAAAYPSDTLVWSLVLRKFTY